LIEVAEIMKEKYPIIYNDFEPIKLEDGTYKWKSKYVKV
jgi:hypothetical protein